MNAILKFCFIFCLIYETEGQFPKCGYSFQDYMTTGSKPTNISYYNCGLNTEETYYNKKIVDFRGQHVAGQSDADVKLIFNKEDSKVKTLSSIFCKKFPNLEAIKIENAELESIDADSLLNCQNLDKLILIENNIQELPENLLINNSKLTLLGIHNNDQLTTLPENFFLSQKELIDLYLHQNQISFLPTNIFHPLVKLEMLHLYSNNLKTINPKWFTSLYKLDFLSLNGNRISEIPSGCFIGLGNLEQLWLFENRIRTLKFDSFFGLENLRVLHLFLNKIYDLPVNVFYTLNNLEELGLQNNKLTTIYSDSFGYKTQLIKLWLQDNKINAIDPKVVYHTAVSEVSMENNICSQSISKDRASVKSDLGKCFDNFYPRPVEISNNCGRSVMPQGSIYGGAQIKPGSYPWIAALLKPNGQFFCGGTLVSNRKVVTAAHCVKDKVKIDEKVITLSHNDLSVLLGFFNLDIKNETGRVNVKVHSIHIHPEWKTQTKSFDADIAVLFLENQVDFSPQIQPICMIPTNAKILSVRKGIVVGNGRSSAIIFRENIPKFLEMPIQENDDCFNKDSFFEFVSSGRSFCAGSADGNVVCSGDSGSGFVVKIETAYYLRGIVSNSLTDPILGCNVNSYSVFTDALRFIDWINGI